MALSVLILQMAFRKTPQVKVILIQYVFFQCYFVMSNCTCVQVNKLLLSFLML